MLDIGYWPLSIGYDYWLLIFTLQNVSMVITHFGYWPLVIGYGYLVLVVGYWLFNILGFDLQGFKGLVALDI